MNNPTQEQIGKLPKWFRLRTSPRTDNQGTSRLAFTVNGIEIIQKILSDDSKPLSHVYLRCLPTVYGLFTVNATG